MKLFGWLKRRREKHIEPESKSPERLGTLELSALAFEERMRWRESQKEPGPMRPRSAD
jgi:hypothetical protein